MASSELSGPGDARPTLWKREEQSIEDNQTGLVSFLDAVTLNQKQVSWRLA